MEPQQTESTDKQTQLFQKIKNKKSKLTRAVRTGAAVVAVAGSFFFGSQYSQSKQQELSALAVPEFSAEAGAFPVLVPHVKWGFALDTFEVSEDLIRKDATLSKLLEDLKVNGEDLRLLTSEAKKIMANGDFRAGKQYVTLSKDGNARPDHLIIQPNEYYYYQFNLQQPVSVQRVDRKIVKQQREIAGVVKGTLWESMALFGLPYDVIDLMEDALKYSVDFSRIIEGDRFKLIFEEDFVEGKSVGASHLKAAYFYNSRKKEEVASYYFEEDKLKGFFTPEGKPWKSGFLKSPLKYSRISSRYNLKRLHPVLGYVKPHFGTDFAAPHGTPIMSVADGVVVEATRKGGNGNYVKIKHNGTYQTQYLHMSRFGKGIRPGTRVQQGQVIGYVGSTGLATGPHVCFRLWKNGKQIDPLREKLPAMEVMSKSQHAAYIQLVNEYKARMEQMVFPTEEEIKALQAEKAKAKP